MSDIVHCSNKWSNVIAACTRAGGAQLSVARWATLCAPEAVSALCACVVRGPPAPAHQVLLAAAKAQPHMPAPLVAALLAMDAQAYARSELSISPDLHLTYLLDYQVCL